MCVCVRERDVGHLQKGIMVIVHIRLCLVFGPPCREAARCYYEGDVTCMFAFGRRKGYMVVNG